MGVFVVVRMEVIPNDLKVFFLFRQLFCLYTSESTKDLMQVQSVVVDDLERSGSLRLDNCFLFLLVRLLLILIVAPVL